jgi:predicted Holliday junction resolvase-like endonuclease
MGSVKSPERIIRSLQSKELIAECSKCGGDFSLSDALLFNGTLEFPDEAKLRKKGYEEELKARRADLRLRKKRAEEGAIVTTRAVRIGQMIEHIVPTFKGFEYNHIDCRPLFDPIDFIAFNGLSKSKVTSLTFMDIKTGKSGLNTNQRRIRDAIKDGRVFYEEVEK